LANLRQRAEPADVLARRATVVGTVALDDVNNLTLNGFALTKVHDRSDVYYNIAQKYKKELTPQNLLASIFKKNSDTPNCQTCVSTQNIPLSLDTSSNISFTLSNWLKKLPYAITVVKYSYFWGIFFFEFKKTNYICSENLSKYIQKV
ncbi:MAG: hypothetical protein IJT30_07550, partial [Muribaculaceae bacterium]|nr:hypothetical protein [Muribaculaceae bacterium]